jgi:Domain of unknown function (DUF1707)
MEEPGDDIAGTAEGRGHLRASHADREQAVSLLKAAFVQGRLAKDEFDLRIGQVLASRTYAELAALTADIPTGLTPAQPLPEPGPRPANGQAVKVWAGMTAVFTGVAAAVVAASPGGNTGERLAGLVMFVVPAVSLLVALLLAFHAWLDRRAGRQSSQALPPGAGGASSQRPASADVAGQLPQVNHDPRHTAEARPARGPDQPLSSWQASHRWRPLGRRYATGFSC